MQPSKTLKHFQGLHLPFAGKQEGDIIQFGLIDTILTDKYQIPQQSLLYNAHMPETAYFHSGLSSFLAS
jgi:hypothetical protein